MIQGVGMCREVSLEMLADAEVGTFVVRDSSTHPRCYALSVKVPRTDKPASVCHYLILPASDRGGYKMKVYKAEYGSMVWKSLFLFYNACNVKYIVLCFMIFY